MTPTRPRPLGFHLVEPGGRDRDRKGRDDDVGGNLDITVTDAIRLYPELADLAALRDEGWLFRPIADNDGQPLGIVGYHNRPVHTDALYIFDWCDAKAVRLLAEQPGAPGGIVWHYEGPLAAAIHELLVTAGTRPPTGTTSHRRAPHAAGPSLTAAAPIEVIAGARCA